MGFQLGVRVPLLFSRFVLSVVVIIFNSACCFRLYSFCILDPVVYATVPFKVRKNKVQRHDSYNQRMHVDVPLGQCCRCRTKDAGGPPFRHLLSPKLQVPPKQAPLLSQCPSDQHPASRRTDTVPMHQNVYKGEERLPDKTAA